MKLVKMALGGAVYRLKPRIYNLYIGARIKKVYGAFRDE